MHSSPPKSNRYGRGVLLKFMKLYIFTVYRNKISREEVEVVEKNKIFEQKRGLSTARYKKEDLDKMDASYGSPKMISLNGSMENFVREVIAYKKRKADSYEMQMIREKNEIIEMQKDYERFIAKNEYPYGFATKFEVVFEHSEDNRIKGNAIKHNGEKIFEVHTLISGNEFISKFENEESIRIVNIFVDGAFTNLYVEECMARLVSATDCVIDMEKLKDLCVKAKVQIDVVNKEE